MPQDPRQTGRNFNRLLGPAGDRLDGPAVAVGIAEEHEVAPRLPVDLADLDAGGEQLLARALDVVHHHLHTPDRAWFGRGDAHADADRARRAARGELDEAQLLAHPVV